MTTLSTRVDPQKNDLTIGDVGERDLVNGVILKRFGTVRDAVTGVADDCAVIYDDKSDDVTVWTIDPCPTPVVTLLGERDLYHWGWMTAVISLSDLAAMGARPRGMLVAVEAPTNTVLADLIRYLDGLEDALRAWGCPLLGGNVKDSNQFSATSTALGIQSRKRVLHRVGARSGDTLFSFGNSGHFWSAVLLRLGKGTDVKRCVVETVERALLKPVPRIREALTLADRGFARCAIDASDGLGGALKMLGEANNIDVIISSGTFLADDAVMTVARAVGIDSRKLLLSWGNWELVFAAAPEYCEQVRRCAYELGSPLLEIGTVQEGSGRVLVKECGNVREISDFSSVRFAKTSYFTNGLDAAMEHLINTPLFKV